MEIFVKLGLKTPREKRIIRDLKNFFNMNPGKKAQFTTAITKQELIRAHYHFCISEANIISEI